MELSILHQILDALKELQTGQSELKQRMTGLEERMTKLEEQRSQDSELLELTHAQVCKLTDGSYKLDSRIMKLEAVS